MLAGWRRVAKLATVPAMPSIASICVYCGSSDGRGTAYREAARRLGTLMAEARVRLVYGGGRIGLMGVLADAVLAGGGEVLGVIPRHLEAREIGGRRPAGELRVVDTMHTRKNLMFDLADAFAVLPGGLGTLDEAFEMLTWRQLRLHDKPIVLVDVDGYWQPLLRLVQHMEADGFVGAEWRQLVSVVDGVENVIPTIRRLPAPAVREAPELL